MENIKKEKYWEEKTKREKYWEEKTDPEKIEKLKDELKRTQRQLEKICTFCSSLINHFHVNDTIAIRMKHPNEESYDSFHFRVEEFKDSHKD